MSPNERETPGANRGLSDNQQITASTCADGSAGVPDADSDDFPLPTGRTILTDPGAAVVGALLQLPVSAGRPVLDLIADDDPADPRVRVVLSLARQLVERGTTPDPTLMFALARSTRAVVGEHRLSRFGAFLADLITSTLVPASLPYYAALVVEGAWRRRITQAGQRFQQLAEEGDTDEIHGHLADELAAIDAIRGRLDRLTGPSLASVPLPESGRAA